MDTRKDGARFAGCTLESSALNNLFALNRLYLDMLAVGARGRSALVFAGPPSELIAASLARLSADRRAALAHSPFALFDAQFSNGAVWKSRVATVRDACPAGFLGRSQTSGAGFTSLALFYAWHLVRLDPLTARIVLGMTEQTQQVFLQMPLAHLQQLAYAEPHLIVPRWSDRNTVWRILLGAANRGLEHLADARQFGIQLSAGDLSSPLPGSKEVPKPQP